MALCKTGEWRGGANDIMPLYEHRCLSCGAVTTTLKAAADSATSVACDACGGEALRIVSRPSVHRSKASKVARLDPRYDKMVDKAMSRTPGADPDRLLKRLKPPSED